MDKDVANLKKWLINMGLDINDASDEMVKKLIPPQQRDMWRNIIKYVMPEEEVNLIKKSLLLQKLQKRKKPLMAKVESEEDLANAIKYEELLTKYYKIEKEIDDVKTKNNELLKYLKNIRVTKDNLIIVNELNKNNSYLTDQTTGYYLKFIHIIKELSKFCDYFTFKANDNLIKKDYEDSLIKCLAIVDHAKQAGIKHDNVNLGNNIFNIFYETLRDKSPSILIKTIEENVTTHINKSITVVTRLSIKKTEQCKYDREASKLFKELLERKLDLNSILSKSEAEKNYLYRKLVENSNLIINDIISQFQVKTVSYSEEQIHSLGTNLTDALYVVMINSLEYSKVIGLPEKPVRKKEKSTVFAGVCEATKKIREKIDHMVAQSYVTTCDFGLPEISTEMEKMAEDYSKKVPNMDEIKKMVISMKRGARTDIENIYKPVPELNIKPEPQKFQTLEEIADHMESLEVFAVLRKQFEDFNHIICGESNIAEITKRECNQEAEFNDSTSQIKSQLLGLSKSFEDCKLVADDVSMKTPN